MYVCPLNRDIYIYIYIYITLAIKQLKQNPEINIKQPDKGSSIVVLNKEDKIKDGQI